jgi:ankyrin repeat protein
MISDVAEYAKYVYKLNGLGFSSLDIAHANGHSRFVELLKQHEFKLTRRSHDLSLRVTELQDMTLQLLQHFVRDSDIKGLTSILKKGADVDTSDSSDQTIVNFASCHGAVAAVAVPIAFKANVNKCDKDGKSPLSCAKKMATCLVSLF